MRSAPVVALLVAGLMVGCGGRLRHLAYQLSEDPIPSALVSARRPDPAPLRKSAYGYHAQDDQVRALREAYRALRMAPKDRGIRLLLGLIYDLGLDRPDLALPEYRRAQGLNQKGSLARQLGHRIDFLKRANLGRRIGASLDEGSPPPLLPDRIAAFPSIPSVPGALPRPFVTAWSI